MHDPIRPPKGSGSGPERGPSEPIILLPASAGGPMRRFAIRPARVLAVVGVLVGAGAMFGAALTFALAFVLGPARLQHEADRLRREVAELRDEVARLRGAEQPGTAEPVPEEEADALRLRPPTGQEPSVRVALLRSRGDIRAEAVGLLLVDPDGHPLNVASDAATLSRSGKGIRVEGVGTSASFPNGTRIEARAPTLKVTVAKGNNSHTLPLPLTLHVTGGEIVLVAELPIERYLPGVVAAEMPASWGIEAKKAQAIAARTYALMQKSLSTGPWDLEAAVEDQAWSGDVVDGSTRAAVASTLGEVLTNDGWVVSTFYSAACAGKTELPAAVWPARPWHGNASVDCTSCARSPYDRWTVDLTPAEVLGALDNPAVSRVRGLHVRQRSTSDRVTRIEAETDDAPIGMTGNEFRRAVGWSRVKSAAFDVTVSGGAFRLSGRGAGHGVGFCQWGSRGRAEAGEDHVAILTAYYPGARIEKIW